MCSIKNHITESVKVIQDIEHLEIDIKNVSKQIVNCIKNGKKIIIFGNGGSAADAQHMAAEFVGRFMKERKSFPAIAISTDTSIITAIGNDYSFDRIFSRQIESLVKKGDVVIAISTSGRSKNILEGLKASKKLGAKVISLTGKNGMKMKLKSDVFLNVPSTVTSRIQEAHRTIIHIICELTEDELTKRKS